MRKNLSEELKINDVIELNDGDESEETKSDDKSDSEKEIQKELDDKNKIADEIRDAETPKPELNDGYGKSTKIKQFVEKLILEEPSDVLNEDLEDELLELRHECVSNIVNDLARFWKSMKKRGIDLVTMADNIESVGDEALFRFEDIYDD